MPRLDWIGKDKVENYHDKVVFHTLEKQYTFNSDKESENKIIHADNLIALKSLLPQYEGKIKCIYIDPPYNTGEEKWKYNDNVNDPRIKKWLGEAVGKQGEDLSRDDKWLCMMYPRLKLLQKLLSNDGVIFISIDDNEQANLKLVCDEIFGERNFIEIFSWRKTYTPSNLSQTSKKCVEYIYCYSKSRNNLTRFKGLIKTNDADNPLIKSNNNYKTLIFPCDRIITTQRNDCFFSAGEYGTRVNKVFLKNDVEFKDGRFLQNLILEGKFIWTQEMLESELNKDTKIIFKGTSFAPRYDRRNYEPEVPRNLIDNEDMVGTTEEGGKILKTIFGEKVFDYPKPPSLIEYLINFICNDEDIILDSFAGSGTTAHAVLKLNKEDGGNRKFILVEMMDYAENITAERVKRVIKGYKDVEGLKGDFSYYELGKPMFKDEENLNEEVGEEKIRQYIYYSETKQPLTREQDKEKKYLLDNYNYTGYYFYYEKDSLTTLSLASFANIIKDKQESYIIYADICTLSEEVKKKYHIVFKKIPRDIRRF
ncbi:MAG: site-specific DNA-methyltransferase [Bacteroidales bacterium]|nr:site-specific DNA-methyltransferase [Bacteroidales bacterium]